MTALEIDHRGVLRRQTAHHPVCGREEGTALRQNAIEEVSLDTITCRRVVRTQADVRDILLGVTGKMFEAKLRISAINTVAAHQDVPRMICQPTQLFFANILPASPQPRRA
jgi:hypothetical protein